MVRSKDGQGKAREGSLRPPLKGKKVEFVKRPGASGDA